MRRALLFALAPTLLLTACYGDPSGEGQNPYMANKDSQPLVRNPADEEGSPNASEPAPAVSTPSPGSLADPDQNVNAPQPAPRDSDLATDYANQRDTFEPATIDPRLTERSVPEIERFEPVRPRTLDAVRPATGETELTAPADSAAPIGVAELPQPADEPAPRLDPPSLEPPALARDEQPAPNDNGAPAPHDASEPLPADSRQPAASDLAGTPPAGARSALLPADSPPSLEQPEVNSVNKPPLEEAAPADELPLRNELRPSERLLQGQSDSGAAGETPLPSDEPIAPEPPRETSPAPQAPVEENPEPAEEPADANDLPPGEASGFRNWVDSTGRVRMEGRFIRLQNGTVIMEVKDNEQVSGRKLKTIESPLDRFSPQDRAFIQRIQRGDFGI